MSQERLGRDVFIALAAIGWADGKLDEEEADAIVRTAVEEGLAIEEIEEIESATKSPVDIGVIDRSSMTKADRLFVYAVAAWMTRLDGTRDDKEIEALDKLGDALKIPPSPRAHADAIAEEIASQPVVWRLAVEAARECAAELPAAGERVAMIGCGTSHYIGQSIATLRESRGLGETDAFTASEFPPGRDHARVIAITRSGTTTEVIRALEETDVPSLALTARPAYRHPRV